MQPAAASRPVQAPASAAGPAAPTRSALPSSAASPPVMSRPSLSSAPRRPPPPPAVPIQELRRVQERPQVVADRSARFSGPAQSREGRSSRDSRDATQPRFENTQPLPAPVDDWDVDEAAAEAASMLPEQDAEATEQPGTAESALPLPEEQRPVPTLASRPTARPQPMQQPSAQRPPRDGDRRILAPGPSRQQQQGEGQGAPRGNGAAGPIRIGAPLPQRRPPPGGRGANGGAVEIDMRRDDYKCALQPSPCAACCPFMWKLHIAWHAHIMKKECLLLRALHACSVCHLCSPDCNSLP